MPEIFINHYAILELPPEATSEEIRRGFWRLAKLHHPDRQGDPLRFHQIHTAYRLLMNPDERSMFDQQYRIFREEERAASASKIARALIPSSRFVFPTNVALLAKRGLLRKKFRGRDRRYHLKLDYDLELPLRDLEFRIPITVPVPVTLRNLCADCLGGDRHCMTCGGRGSYKSGSLVRLDLNGGLTSGQVIEISLVGMRPAPLSYYKKRKIRIKITRLVA